MRKISAEAQYVIAAGAKLAAMEKPHRKNSKGLTLLAQLVSADLGRSIDRAAMQKVTIGDRKLKADEMLSIERKTGLPAPSSNIPNQVPLIEWVAAGQFAEPLSQIPVEDVPMLTLTDLGRGDFMALKVSGNSMDRLCPEGSVIVVNRADKKLVPGKPYVFSLRGLTSFKLWHANPDYLDPHSWDASNKPIFIKRKRDVVVVGRAIRAIVDL